MRLTRLVLGLALVLVLTTPPAWGRADDLATLLPDGRLAEVHVPDGMAVRNSELGRRIYDLLDAQRAFDELRAGLGTIQLLTGSDSDALLELVLGGELELGVYPTSRRKRSEPGARKRQVLAIARAADAEGLTLAMHALQAALAAQPDAKVTTARHRSRTFLRFENDTTLAQLDDLLILATEERLLTAAMDRHPGAPDARETRPAAAANEPAAVPLATFVFDTRLARPADLKLLQAPTRALLGRRLANPLANLLFGGLTLGEGTVHGSLSGTGDEILLEACLPPVPDDAPRAWFPPATDAPMLVPTTPETLAVLHMRRDLADWWRQRETYMPESAQPALAKADQNMAMLFAGQSPAEDVFGQAAMQQAIVVDRQRFARATDVPDVRLPAFCLVTRLADPEGFTPTLAVAFQTLMGLVNTGRARDGKAPFLLDTLEQDGVDVRAARLLAGAGSGGAGEPPAIDFNFSPAVAVADGWALIGTSAEQVQRLVAALAAGTSTQARGILSLDIDATATLGALSDNRGALIAQRMLEDGLDPEQAAARIDELLALVSGLRRIGCSLEREPDCLHFELHLLLGTPTQ